MLGLFVQGWFVLWRSSWRFKLKIPKWEENFTLHQLLFYIFEQWCDREQWEEISGSEVCYVLILGSLECLTWKGRWNVEECERNGDVMYVWSTKKFIGSKSMIGSKLLGICCRRVFQTNQQPVKCRDFIKYSAKKVYAFSISKVYLLFYECFSYYSFVYVLVKQHMK